MCNITLFYIYVLISIPLIILLGKNILTIFFHFIYITFHTIIIFSLCIWKKNMWLECICFSFNYYLILIITIVNCRIIKQQHHPHYHNNKHSHLTYTTITTTTICTSVKHHSLTSFSPLSPRIQPEHPRLSSLHGAWGRGSGDPQPPHHRRCNSRWRRIPVPSNSIRKRESHPPRSQPHRPMYVLL